MGSPAHGVERFVAFLKGINVGGHTVKMDRLRGLIAEIEFESSRLDEVESYIASGNIIFSSASRDLRGLEAAIASHLESALGYSVPTFVRTIDALVRIAAAKPFPDVERGPDGPALYVAFLPGPPGPTDVKRIEAAGTETDLFKVERSELYWLCRTRFSESPFFGPAFERLLGTAATVRNSTTLRKLAEKHGTAPL